MKMRNEKKMQITQNLISRAKIILNRTILNNTTETFEARLQNIKIKQTAAREAKNQAETYTPIHTNTP